MCVADYVAEIRRQILDTPHVVSHSLGYEDRPPIGAIVNGTVTFVDGSCLYIKEFLHLRPTPTRLKYSYHYTSPTRSLIFDTTMLAIPGLDSFLLIQAICTPRAAFYRLPSLNSHPFCARQPAASGALINRPIPQASFLADHSPSALPV